MRRRFLKEPADKNSIGYQVFLITGGSEGVLAATANSLGINPVATGDLVYGRKTFSQDWMARNHIAQRLEKFFAPGWSEHGAAFLEKLKDLPVASKGRGGRRPKAQPLEDSSEQNDSPAIASSDVKGCYDIRENRDTASWREKIGEEIQQDLAMGFLKPDDLIAKASSQSLRIRSNWDRIAKGDPLYPKTMFMEAARIAGDLTSSPTASDRLRKLAKQGLTYM